MQSGPGSDVRPVFLFVMRAAARTGTPLWFQFYMIEAEGAAIWTGQFNIEMGLNGAPTNVGRFEATLSCAGFLSFDVQPAV